MFKDVDILVFPEAGLTGVILPDDRKEIRTFLTEIPSPESNTIPCFTQYCSAVSTNQIMFENIKYKVVIKHRYLVVDSRRISGSNPP